ncbi:SDR family NAD(P)-dependent oxidoreductase [Nocardia sp. NPDC058658]|uniref:SDR family NAD(P)-dependent oxidoreductase n=1 Tax=Nocardia sp. NPDC058658 TaxID=3346580 RepID=UPI00365847CD
MELRPTDTALVTGASRGMGVLIARALAERGVNLALVARSADALEGVARTLREETDVRVSTFAADLADTAALPEVWARVEAELGSVDILVNNAGLEGAQHFPEASVEDLAQMVAVNLTAPMILTRLVIPGMIERGRGHVVNIASIAGLLPSAYEEPYNASKFGLVGFTRSLRLSAEDAGWGVGASAVCPGFMADTGMYDDMTREFGVRAPRLMPQSPAAAIGPAVIGAIERNRAEVIVMKGAPRAVVALAAATPRTFERISARFDLAGVFRSVAKARKSG